jgi:hypothetical protein
MSATQLTALAFFLRAEVQLWEKVLVDANIKLEKS